MTTSEDDLGTLPAWSDPLQASDNIKAAVARLQMGGLSPDHYDYTKAMLRRALLVIKIFENDLP